ncbi:heme ABC exporter ATP-binding protein CcmA [Aquamicrobium segne]|uniref:Heme ABC exporter ATP-binding protein CcmA n=1 Tax=Aquamicrobium segne TaxID=469547 RepID=A0ABW0GVH0_9HYPH
MRLIGDNLSAERGGDPIFAQISFTVESGQALVITGPNGSGKSTLLRVIAGLLPAMEGQMRLEGAGDNWPTPAAACHYVGHLNAMKTALSVNENLQFWQHFMGEPALGIAEALDEVELGHVGHLPFGYLSTGQKRRAALARLLTSHRPVWLLDEPTAGLDKASETRLAALMKRHLDTSGIILAATHLPLGIKAEELRMGDTWRG